jgi:hypothetical protein
VLPRKITREELEVYDSLGDLARQILDHQHHSDRAGEFRLRLPGAPTIFAARRELLGHLGRVRGVAGVDCLVTVLRDAISRSGIGDE